MKHVILAPIVTEKTSMNEVHGVYAFRVHNSATKIDVENSFKKLFGDTFTLEKVRIANVVKKERNVGRSKTITKRKAYKKAIIYLTKNSAPLDLTKLSA